MSNFDIKLNTDSLISRLRARSKALAPGSAAMQEALTRAGLIITARAKMNVRRLGIIDTGRLLNSIRYELYTTGNAAGVRVGSFGVPYAAMHEFGGPFSERQRRAMFAAMRRRGGPPRPSKNVIQGSHFRARPYLRPAVKASAGQIIDALREALGTG